MPTQTILFLSFCIVLQSTTSAQIILGGRLANEQNSPIANAKIFSPFVKQESISRADGSFQFSVNEKLTHENKLDLYIYHAAYGLQKIEFNLDHKVEQKLDSNQSDFEDRIRLSLNQLVKIGGKVKDFCTNDPIKNLAIILESTNLANSNQKLLHTTSNADGDFSFLVHKNMLPLLKKAQFVIQDTNGGYYSQKALVSFVTFPQIDLESKSARMIECSELDLRGYLLSIHLSGLHNPININYEKESKGISFCLKDSLLNRKATLSFRHKKSNFTKYVYIRDEISFCNTLNTIIANN